MKGLRYWTKRLYWFRQLCPRLRWVGMWPGTAWQASHYLATMTKDEWDQLQKETEGDSPWQWK
jgi:REP element-mobilizing transposase RayT